MKQNKETCRDIREEAYQEMFDFINWLATQHKEKWVKWCCDYPGRGNWE